MTGTEKGKDKNENVNFLISIPQISLVVVISVLLTAVTVLAASGTTDAPAAPGSTSSYTLEDIYQRLSNGTAASQSAFTEPAVAPGTGSMHSLNDIYAVIPDAGSDVAGGGRLQDLRSSRWHLSLEYGSLQ